jgi:harmonin
MKSSSVLELIVRTCAGLDLFPGESSGYNSSASSITGDQSPCWGESSKRLSVVREESTSSGDRLKGLNGYKSTSSTNEWQRQDRPVPVEIPKIPKQQQMLMENNATTHSRNSNTTVIKLSEDGPTMINNTLVPSLKTINNTVYEEISNAKTHDSQAQKSTVTSNLMMKKSESSKVIMIEQKPHSVTKIESSALENFGRVQHHQQQQQQQQNPSSEQSSLSDAINEELRKRAEKKQNPACDSNSESKIDVAVNKSKMNAPPIHNMLMDEFRIAHQRMFKNTTENHETHQHDNNLEVSNRCLGVKLSMIFCNNKEITKTLSELKDGAEREIWCLACLACSENLNML